MFGELDDSVLFWTLKLGCFENVKKFGWGVSSMGFHCKF